MKKKIILVLGCDVAYGALHEFPKEQSEIVEEIIKGKEYNEQTRENDIKSEKMKTKLLIKKEIKRRRNMMSLKVILFK